jgi:hypothetical protein
MVTLTGICLSGTWVVYTVVTETIETKLLNNGMLKLKNNAVYTSISALSLCSNLRTVTIVSVTVILLCTDSHTAGLIWVVPEINSMK